MRVFVYECVSAGGLGSDVPASLRREGRAMLDAAVEDFQQLPDAEVVMVTRVDQFHETAARCDWTLVIAPEFDNLLRDLSQIVLDVGGRLLGSLPDAIELTGDKLATARVWQRRGVAHPRTDTLNAVRFLPPWVVKPRHGAGSQATFLIRDAADWEHTLQAARQEWPRGELLWQLYIAGQAASVALLIGPKQTIALLPARQHLSSDGRFRYEGGSLPLPKPLADRAVRVALEAVKGIEGLHGYVGVDMVLGENDVDYAIEINPRLTTSYIGLRQLCRQNLAELMVHCIRGEKIEAPTWKAGKVQIRSEPERQRGS